MRMRAVVADDDALARQELRQVLKEIGDVEIVGECRSAVETVQLANLTRPDLLFVDLHTTDQRGLDLVDVLSSVLKENGCQIICVTASDRYAVRAFEIHAIDYVLKPYTADRLRIALNRARKRQPCRPTQIDAANFITNLSNIEDKRSGRNPSRLVFKARGRILFLHINDIRWIEAEENYIRIYAGSDSHLMRETITGVQHRLDPYQFVRVHRSRIVNLQYVREVKKEPGGDGSVILRSGETIPMSRNYTARIQKILNV